MGSHDTHSETHILPLRVYLTVGLALLVLTGVTVWVAQFQLGELNVIVAMAIAATKAILVAFFFMHLFYDNKIYFTIFASSLAFLAVFIVLTMYDTNRRGEIYEEKVHPIDPKAIIYQNQNLDAPLPKEQKAEKGLAPDTAATAIPRSVNPTNSPTDTSKGTNH